MLSKSFVINIPSAEVLIEPLLSGKTRVSVRSLSPEAPDPSLSWETIYSGDVVKALLKHDPTVRRLHDEFVREESPEYSQRSLTYYLLSFLEDSQFHNKRILDFGCGCGASTMVMARMFPTAQLVGTDRLEECIDVCRLKARDGGTDKVRFIASSSDSSLPESIGTFDFIVLCGVYEHLLPPERESLLPDFWAHLNPRGILFISQTPNWNFPIETHITEFPLIHYLPKRLAYPIAVKVLKEKKGYEVPWEELLRRGLRGASTREIERILRKAGASYEFVQPSRLGMKDSIDIWMATLDTNRRGRLKRIIGKTLKAANTISGINLAPYLNLAIRKKLDHSCTNERSKE